MKRIKFYFIIPAGIIILLAFFPIKSCGIGYASCEHTYESIDIPYESFMEITEDTKPLAVIIFEELTDNYSPHLYYNSVTKIVRSNMKKSAEEISELNNIYSLAEKSSDFVSRFDFPVGWPDAKEYHDLQSFQENNHLGEDWNDMGGCDSDLGQSVYAIANGFVVSAKDEGQGWGNVIRIVHKYKSEDETILVESVYAHLEKISVKENTKVNAGDQIGTIGNANGVYCAHLHLEIRTSIGLPLGGGYSNNIEGFTSPTEFIKKHRTIN